MNPTNWTEHTSAAVRALPRETYGDDALADGRDARRAGRVFAVVGRERECPGCHELTVVFSVGG